MDRNAMISNETVTSSFFDHPEGPIIFSLNRKYEYVFFNKKHLETIKAIWGIEIHTGLNMLNVISNEVDKEKARKNFDRALSGESFKKVEEYGDEKLGRFWYEDQYYPYYDNNGDIKGLTVYVLDITDKVDQETKLTKKLEYNLNGLKKGKIGLFDYNLLNERVRFSKGWKQQLGYLDKELSNTKESWFDRIHPDDVSLVKTYIHQIVHQKKERTFELTYRLKHKNGKYIWILSKGSHIINEEGISARIVGSHTDISIQKEKEIQLAAEENIVTQAEEAANFGHFAFDFTKESCTYSKQLHQIFGTDENATPNVQTWLDLVSPEDKKKLKVYLEEVISKRLRFDKKYWIINQKTGLRRYVHGLGKLIEDFRGNLISMVGTIRDITEEHQKQLEIERLSRVAKHSHSGVFITDAQGKIKWINDSLKETLGYSIEELQGLTPTNAFTGPNTIEEDIVSFNKGIASKMAFSQEIINYTKSGKPIWQELTVSPVYNENKELSEFIGIQKDITKRKEAEEELEKMSTLARFTLNGVLIADMNGNTTWTNEGFTNITGYTQDEVLNQNALNRLKGDNTDLYNFLLISSSLTNKRPVHQEILIRTKQNTDLWVDVQITPLFFENGDVKGYVCTLTDINQRKITSLNLEERKLRIKNITNSIPGVVLRFKLKKDGTYLVDFISDACKEMLGILPEEAVNDIQSIWKLIEKENKAVLRKIVEQSANTNSTCQANIKITTTLGEEKWINLKGTPQIDSCSEDIIWDSILLDITEQKRLETKLTESIRQLELGAKTAKLGFFQIYTDEKLPYINEEFFRIWEITKEEVYAQRGEWWKQYVHSDDLDHTTKVFESGLSGNHIESDRFRIVTKNGNIKYIEARSIPIYDQHNKMISVLGINMEVTKLAQNEISLSKALSDKNTLIQELHHRIKNNLQMVSSILYMKSRTSSNKEFKSFANEIDSRIKAVASIHEHLLSHEESNTIYIRKYLLTILKELTKAYSNTNLEITIEDKISNFKINVDIALTLGLILNESVSNSLKYAFKDRKQGTIAIAFLRTENKYSLTISDDGKGYDEQEIRPDSIGLTLINRLAEQINGEIIQTNNNGISYKIAFPVNG